MNKATLQISVVPQLYCAGRTEDGMDFHAERYVIWAEAPNGTRHEHSRCFLGARVHPNEEDGGSFFEDIREEAQFFAEALATRVRNHVNNGGDLNMYHWRQIDPAYGSQSYIMDDIEAERAAQERFES